MIDPEERASMVETVRGALREAREGAAGVSEVDGVLAELGWLDLFESEPGDMLDIVFTALGATDTSATALDDVLATALGEKPRGDLAIVLPAFAGWAPPGELTGGQLRVRGLATARAASARTLLVVAGTASEPKLAELAVADAEVSRVGGADPALGLHRVEATTSGDAARPLDAAAWTSALALGRRAAGHQIAGACRAMLDLARTHALEREQFGRPIARFQAVQHKLSETLVAIEALEATLDVAREDPNPQLATLAKASAGHALRIVAKHCQQVLAGIGFTTEHAFHLYLKRCLALEGLFGSGDALVAEIGRGLLAERRVPKLIEL